MNGSPNIIASIGKGGVGKTTVAGALAYSLSQQGKKTGLFDINKRDAVGVLRELSPQGNIDIPYKPESGRLVPTRIENLYVGGINTFNYTPLVPLVDKRARKAIRERDIEFSEYIAQFSNDYGFVAF